MSHVKMLMKCLNGENTLVWEHAWSGILMAVGLSELARLWRLLLLTATINPGSNKEKTDILAQTWLSKPGKAAPTLPVGVILVCMLIMKPIHQSAGGSCFHVIPCSSGLIIQHLLLLGQIR